MGSDGRVDIDGETATLIFERRLPHPPERVWRALTDPEELRQWFMAKAKIDGRPGGSIEMIAGPAQFHWTGRILTWNPVSVLEYEFNAEPCEQLPDGERSVVRYELRSVGACTLLTLTHSRLSKRTALGFAPGTHAFLDRLEAHLASRPLPHWRATYDAAKSAYPTWS